MLDGGVDTRYLARRIVRMAWEDIDLVPEQCSAINQRCSANL